MNSFILYSSGIAGSPSHVAILSGGVLSQTWVTYYIQALYGDLLKRHISHPTIRVAIILLYLLTYYKNYYRTYVGEMITFFWY